MNNTAKLTVLVQAFAALSRADRRLFRSTIEARYCPLCQSQRSNCKCPRARLSETAA